MRELFMYIHSSRLLLYACFSIVVVVAVATLYAVPMAFVVAAGSMGVVLFVRGRSWRTRIVAVCLLAASLSAWRVLALPEYIATNAYDQMYTFRAVVVREPEIRVDSQRLVVETRAVDGLVQIKRPLQPRFAVGDVVEVYCFLREPEPFDGFAYDKYLQRHGIGGLCHYPGMNKIGEEHDARYYLFRAKAWVISRFQQSLAAPEHSLILGAVFGDKRAIPQNVMDAFRATGTSHILVISGMHVALLTAMLMNLLQQFGLGRRSIAFVTIGTLAVYVLATGLQSSAIRASLFGSTALMAQLLGRQKNSVRMLLVVATGMLLWNPLLLWYDVGFQLSFAATAGIIVLSARCEEWLRFMPQLLGLRMTAATSLAAIIATTPISVYHFGTFSVIALLANLIVVPLMPVIMIYSLATILLSLISTQLATWFSLPLYYLLHWLIRLVVWLSEWEFAQVTIPL